MAEETVNVLIDTDGNHGDVAVVGEGEACESDAKMFLFWLQSEAGQAYLADAPATGTVTAPVVTVPTQSEQDVIASVLAAQNIDPPAVPVVPATGDTNPTPGA